MMSWIMSYYIIHVNKEIYELEPSHRLHVWSGGKTISCCFLYCWEIGLDEFSAVKTVLYLTSAGLNQW